MAKNFAMKNNNFLIYSSLIITMNYMAFMSLPYSDTTQVLTHFKMVP